MSKHAQKLVSQELAEDLKIAESTPAAKPKFTLDLPVVPEDPEERVEAIEAVAIALYKRNNRSDFGANGHPKRQVIERILGFQLGTGELQQACDQAKAKFARGEVS